MLRIDAGKLIKAKNWAIDFAPLALVVLGCLLIFALVLFAIAFGAEEGFKRDNLRYSLRCDDGYQSEWYKYVKVKRGAVTYRNTDFSFNSVYIIPAGVACSKESI